MALGPPLTFEQKRILSKLLGELEDHVVPPTPVDYTTWRCVRVSYAISLYQCRINAQIFHQIRRDRDGVVLAGHEKLFPTPRRLLSKFYADFDRIVNERTSRLLDGPTHGEFRRAHLTELVRLSALIERYAI